MIPEALNKTRQFTIILKDVLSKAIVNELV